MFYTSLLQIVKRKNIKAVSIFKYVSNIQEISQVSLKLPSTMLSSSVHFIGVCVFVCVVTQ